VLDAGSTLLGQMLALQSEGRVIVEAMQAMGYDAMTVGQADFMKGVDVLLQRAQEAEFAIVSCNIVSTDTGEPILKPYTVLERGGLRFGILGVSEPGIAKFPTSGMENIQILDPVETVREYLPEVQAQSDVVILLSHIGFEEDRLLAEAVPGIDIIIGGRTRQIMTAPERVGQTIIVQMGYDGEWMGKLHVAWNSERQITGASVEVLDLGPNVRDNPELAELVESYESRYAETTE